MSIYTATDARQKFDELLEEANRHQKVLIRRAENELFLLTRISSSEFPENLPDLHIGLTRDEIVSYIREVRER